MVNLSSIQNWIANVVSETIKQKQGEMSSAPLLRVGELSCAGAASLVSGYGRDEDKASLLSGAYSSSGLSQGGGRAPSLLSRGGSSSISGVTGKGSADGSRLGAKKNKVTTTSVPLFSLVQDEVDMGKLDAMDKEIKSDMRDKMAVYEKKRTNAAPFTRKRNPRRTRTRKKRGRNPRRSFWSKLRKRRNRRGPTTSPGA